MNSRDKKLPPLYYAIILHFQNGQTDSAQGVVDALMNNYETYKLFNIEDVEEALATAKENGLLEEIDYQINESGELIVYYQITEFGKEMIAQYLF